MEMKKVLFLTVLMVLVAGLAFAQRPTPTATIHQQGLTGQGVQANNKPGVSGILFYGGDIDTTSPNADGLWTNNNSLLGLSGQVFSPFVIPKTTKWSVSSLFTNVLYNPFPPAIDSASWDVVSITTNSNTIPPSTTATIVCSGTDSSPVLTDTGRNLFGFYEEFTTAVAVAGCDLKGGPKGADYWESVTVNTSTFQLAYESNVNDTPPPNAIGTPEPANNSYFYGPAFGATTLVNANTQGPFSLFSAGVAGTSSK
jgi:hypothetical protein